MSASRDGNLNAGFIVMHRKCIEWEWYTTPGMFQLFFYLIVKSNHQQTKFKGHIIGRGQCVTGLNSLAKATGLTYQAVRSCLTRLEQTNEITRKSTNKFTIVTICNYSKYQDLEITTNKQTTNKQQTNNKQTTTSKQCKQGKQGKQEKKSIKEKYGFFRNVSLTKIELDKLSLKFNGQGEEKIDALSEYIESSGKRYKSHYATILSWARRDANKKQGHGQPRATTVHQAGIIQRDALAQQLLKGKKDENKSGPGEQDSVKIEHTIPGNRLYHSST